MKNIDVKFLYFANFENLKDSLTVQLFNCSRYAGKFSKTFKDI